MQGIWKENISGYNKKGFKRKKFSRKHTLKDKAKWHITNCDARKGKAISNRTKWENKYEFIGQKVKTEREIFVDVYKIKVLGSIEGVDCSFIEKETKKTRIAFSYRDHWYDFYTKELINKCVKELVKIETMYINWDQNKDKYRNLRFFSYGNKDRLFLYGKPLVVDYYNTYGFYSTKDRIYAQTRANRMDRRRIKIWIDNRDYDKEVKTHALSKTIAWEIW